MPRYREYMLLRVTVAILCSIIVFRYLQSKRNSAHGTHRGSPQQPANERTDSSTEESEKITDEASQGEEEEGCRMETINPVSSSKRFHNSDLSLPLSSDSDNDDAVKGEPDTDCDLYMEPDIAEFSAYDDRAWRIPATPENSLDKTENQNNSEAESQLQNARVNANMGLQHKESEAETQPQNEQEDSNMELELELEFYLKSLEIENLDAQIINLEGRVRVLSEELKGKENIEDELQSAREKIRELHKTLCGNANQTKAELLILKEQVAKLHARERNTSNKDSEMETELQRLKELEIQVLELRRTNKELQCEKRDLMIRLDTVERRIAQLSSTSENSVIVELQAQAARLQEENADLNKQVERLHMNWFIEAEELVYLRWVNACLRHELKNYHLSPGKATAVELNKSLSPRSMKKAKQLMIEYAGSDLTSDVQTELDYDGVSSLPSASPVRGMDDSSADTNSMKHKGTKVSGFFGKFKKRGKGKEASHHLSTFASSDSKDPQSSMFVELKGPSNAFHADSVSKTTRVMNDVENRRHSSTDTGDSFGLNRRNTSSHPEESSDISMSPDLVRNMSKHRYPPNKGRQKLALPIGVVDIDGEANQGSAESMKENIEPVILSSLKMEYPTFVERDSGRISNAEIVTSESIEGKALQLEENLPRLLESFVTGPTGSNVRVKGRETALFGQTDPARLQPCPPRTYHSLVAPFPPPRQYRVEGIEECHQLTWSETGDDTSFVSSNVDNSDVDNDVRKENLSRSGFSSPVKQDVARQVDFVKYLANEVENAAYVDMKDVAAFVSWLDEQLSFVGDEYFVRNHSYWPERKVNLLRQAACGYLDMKKLELDIASFEADANVHCQSSSEKILSFLELVEQRLYSVTSSRDKAMTRYKEFNIPTGWMLDSGFVGKIKLAAIQSAKKYIERVAQEINAMKSDSITNEPHREYLALQAVQFALRVHQFAGRIDAESMLTFEELKNQISANL